ncbi:MAG: fold metallo-hydrolase [Frankiales bacterium]|nr:fold metallo-hydrolase [Frankiales bacterium]
MTGVRRVIPLTLGWETLPKSWSVDGCDPSVRLREPVPGVLLEVDGGWVLLDTGFNPALVHDPVLHLRFHGRNHDISAELPPGDGDPLLESLAAHGLDVPDISVVALSHLHNDHAGGVRHWAGREAQVHVQRVELEYGLGPHPEPEHNGMFRIDYDDPLIPWVLADGDCEIAPGVRAVSTPGHTPGHQSFVVSLAGGGGYVFAFDAADLQENIDDELPVGGRIGATPEDTVEQIRKLKAIAAREDLRLVPGHDPVVWPALTRELLG